MVSAYFISVPFKNCHANSPVGSFQLCLFITINRTYWYCTMFSVTMTFWDMLFEEFGITKSFSCHSLILLAPTALM